MSSVVVDMHTHTTCSDGVLTPGELVEKAVACGLKGLAITDHDTIQGVYLAQEAAQDSGVEIIPGVELSVRHLGRELHLLGYCFDCENELLKDFLAQYQVMRRRRAEAIVVRLNALGVGLGFDQVRAVAEGPAIGRPHIAQALVAHGYVDNAGQAFIRYLRNGGPADVAKELPSAESAIKMLHDAGGIAVLAHPGHWVSDRDVKQLHALGLDGLELFHPSHNEMLVNFYREVAYGLSMVTTGGSDFHGQRSYDEKNFGVFGLTEDQFKSFECHQAA